MIPSSLRTLIRKITFKLVNLLAKTNIGLSLVNYIYNHVSWQNKRIIQTHFVFPGRSFTWKIKLLNGGYMKSYVSKDDLYTFHLALLYHNISPQLCIIEKEINDLLLPEQVYFDIGANQGMRSFLMLQSNRKTIMFEPNPYLNGINKSRCELNGFTNYSLEQLCLSDKDGFQKFYFSNEPSMSSLKESFATIRGISKTETVKTVTLDKYVEENDLKEMHPFIKIDVEGHELEVLDGAQNTIHNLKPTFIIEAFEKSQISKIHRMFSPLGYTIFGINFGAENILTQIPDIDFLDNYKASDYLITIDPKIVSHFSQN